jgi:hypothetical protein
MRRLSVLCAFVFAAATMLPVPAAAQMNDQKSGVTPPPKIISIGREEIKHGRQAAHEKNEAAWTQALTRAKASTTFLAADSVTGPSQVLWISGYTSFAAYEADFKSQSNTPAIASVNMQYGASEADDVGEDTTMLASYREDLSYGAPVAIGQYRYFSVRTTRVKLGHNADFVELLKTVNEYRQANNIDAHIAVYQVISGAPGGTFMSFTPRKSLAEMDTTNQMPPDVQQKVNELVEKAIAGYSDTIYAFNPKMSKPTEAIAAADPTFWKPKVTMAKMAMPAADTKPVAKKENKP